MNTHADRNQNSVAGHDLFKINDTDAPDHLKNRFGKVVMDQCRKCGKAEADLDGPCEPPFRPVVGRDHRRRDGRGPVRIVRHDASGFFPLVAYDRSPFFEGERRYTENGFWHETMPSIHDLVGFWNDEGSASQTGDRLPNLPNSSEEAEERAAAKP